MILRLSHKLNPKIKAGKLTDIPLDENQYADWSCHLAPHDVDFYLNGLLLLAVATKEDLGYRRRKHAFKLLTGSRDALEGDVR